MGIDISVHRPSLGTGRAASAGRPRNLTALPRPGGGNTTLMSRRTPPNPFGGPPKLTAGKQERYARMGGPVASTTGIAWEWPPQGPYLTSLVLESPRSPDFSIDMCLEDEQTTTKREALRAGLSKLSVRSPTHSSKERACLSTKHEGLASLTAELELLASEKVDILRAADDRSRFTGAEDMDEMEDNIHWLVQRNLRLFDQDGFPELNTLKRHESVALRVRRTSDHLLASKGEAKAPIKVKSYRVRLEELEAKVATYRSSPADRSTLQRRVRQHKIDKLKMSGGGTQIADFRQGLSSGAFRPEKKAQLIALRATADEMRLLAARRKRDQQLAEESAHLISDMQERAERKEAMRVETERKRLAARNMQVVQVLLPAVVAAARFELWSSQIAFGRVERIRLQECESAVKVIQRYYKWKTWRQTFQNKIKAKRILSKHMWLMMLQWRIRRKSKAVSRIVTGLREMGQTLEVVAAFARYKYRIRIMQRQMRSVLAAKRSQLAVATHQYRKARQHYKGVQMGGEDDLSPSGKDDKKKKKKKGEKKRGTSSDVRGVNFLLLADGNNEIVISELRDLVKKRRHDFACHLQEWRTEFIEWKGRAQKLQAEVETERMVGRPPQDHSDEAIPTTYPFLFDHKSFSYSWGRFLQIDESKRKQDDRYRLRGPPRPLLSVSLDEELELFPLFHRVRQKS